MNSPDEANEIRRHMRELRKEVSGDVDALFHQIRKFSDWRYHWRNHPWLCLGTVATLGYFVVPKRYHVISSDPAALAKVTKNRRLFVEEPSQTNKAGSVSAALLAIAGRMMLRGTMNYLQKNGPRLVHDLWINRKHNQ
jgi:hypothetical protein